MLTESPAGLYQKTPRPAYQRAFRSAYQELSRTFTKELLGRLVAALHPLTPDATSPKLSLPSRLNSVSM